MRALLLIAAAILLLVVAALVVNRRSAANLTAAESEVAASAASSSTNRASPKKSAKGGAPASVNAPKAAGEVLVHAAWGSEPGQFGRRREQESNPEAPMAIAAGASGDFAVVDQINRRVQRFHDGKLTATIPLGGDTVQDVALGTHGRTLLLDRLADKNVQVYDASGKLANEVSLTGAGVPEGGAVTGVFSDDNGIYVEADHDKLVRIADADGHPDANRPQLLGRPTRDGQKLITASLPGRGASEATVSAFDRATGQLAWTQTVPLGAPVLHLLMLDSDAAGMIYLAADVGAESPDPPYAIVDERIVIARLGSGGAPRGAITVPAPPTADETFRPITVDDSGAVYVMVATDHGLDVVRYTFP